MARFPRKSWESLGWPVDMNNDEIISERYRALIKVIIPPIGTLVTGVASAVEFWKRAFQRRGSRRKEERRRWWGRWRWKRVATLQGVSCGEAAHCVPAGVAPSSEWPLATAEDEPWAERRRGSRTGCSSPLAPGLIAPAALLHRTGSRTLERTRVQARQGQQGRSRTAAAPLCGRRSLTRRVTADRPCFCGSIVQCLTLRAIRSLITNSSSSQRCRPKQGFKLCV